MSAGPVSRPWRRFLRFSVRGLIVLVLVIGVWLGWLVRSARIQREAVAAITRAGGMVHYDWDWSNGGGGLLREPRYPRWLIGQLGVDYFGHVTRVSIWNLKHLGGGLSQIGTLTRLEMLSIPGGMQVTNTGVAHLQSLTSLQALQLPRSNLTDADLARLAGLSKIELLDLGSTAVTDTGLVQLVSFTRLKSLDLTDCRRITDSGLEHLAALRSLEFLALTWCNIGDDALNFLKSLTRLQKLSLQGTSINDAGLMQIRHLARLQDLDLANTAVSDAGLLHLKTMSALRSLDLSITKVTEAGVRDLNRALPKLKVVH
jgi:internalin A